MTLDEAPQALIEGAAELEAALKAEVADRPLPLYRMMAYHMGWAEENGDRRVAPPPLRARGALALLTCRAFGGETPAALPHATAVEYLFNHTLIHDDVRDGNPERDGRASVWYVWGPAQAINTGDGMHALARLALFALADRGVGPEVVSEAMRLLDEANLATCEGQYRDITLQERLDVGTADYLSMAEAQTGALVGCAAQLGALAAGAAGEPAAAMGRFGRALGTAMRLADDYGVFWPAGASSAAQQGRLAAKKKTFPVAHLTDNGSPAERREAGRLYMERVIDEAAGDRLKAILEGAGSDRFTLDEMARQLRLGDAALADAGLPGDAAGQLRDVARYLAGRDE